MLTSSSKKKYKKNRRIFHPVRMGRKRKIRFLKTVNEAPERLEKITIFD